MCVDAFPRMSELNPLSLYIIHAQSVQPVSKYMTVQLLRATDHHTKWLSWC